MSTLLVQRVHGWAETRVATNYNRFFSLPLSRDRHHFLHSNPLLEVYAALDKEQTMGVQGYVWSIEAFDR